MYAVERRCNGMGLTGVDLRLRLFDALVLPIVYFGCEVWGPRTAGTKQAVDDVEQI